MKTSEFRIAVPLIVVLLIIAGVASYYKHHALAATAPITAGIVSAGYSISRSLSKNFIGLFAQRMLKMSAANPPNIIAGAETAAANAITGPVDAAVANLVKNLKFVGPDGAAAIQALANQTVATLVTVAGDAVNYYAGTLVEKL